MSSPNVTVKEKMSHYDDGYDCSFIVKGEALRESQAIRLEARLRALAIEMKGEFVAESYERSRMGGEIIEATEEHIRRDHQGGKSLWKRLLRL